MIIIKTINSKNVEFANVAAVFETNRKKRNEYFGKYVADPKNKQLNLSAIDAKIEELTKAYDCYKNNLEALSEAVKAELKEEARKKIADKKPDEVAADVDYMTPEQLAALKAAIDAKMNQQQN